MEETDPEKTKAGLCQDGFGPVRGGFGESDSHGCVRSGLIDCAGNAPTLSALPRLNHLARIDFGSPKERICLSWFLFFAFFKYEHFSVSDNQGLCIVHACM